MDSPIKKSSYAAQVEQSNDNQLLFLPVPGPTGEKGPRGDSGPQGEQGIPGPKGEKGDPGKDGKNGKDGNNGKNGVDGKSILSPSEQMLGWAYYENNTPKQERTGIDKGNDGWVSLTMDSSSKNNNEKYLPIGNVALWNKSTERINLKSLNIGSVITIRYNLALETYTTNTEVWFKTFLGEEKVSPISYVGNLKYQYEYDFSVEQKIFVGDKDAQVFGGIPQIRTDNPAEAVLRSIYIVVQ